MGNAIKFTPVGGRVTLGCERRGSSVLIWVTDTGPGMREDQLAHVFERYWQAQRGGAGGLGLGLYISKALVEAQGGEICVDSKPGEGTKVCFTLPLDQSQRRTRPQ
jgi:signal transduction histidine kinase